MKILRTVNRRGLGTESIGFYALLKPKRWFAASRLPGSFHYLAGRSKVAAPAPEPGLKALEKADSKETTMLSQVMESSGSGRERAQTGLIFLAAIAATLFVLWFIIVGAPPNNY
jgi:hypothetical protein